MLYSVKYRKIGSLVWNKLKNVKGDGLISETNGGYRYFILNNEERIEIPMQGIEFRYSTERFLMIKQNMEKDAGQVLPIKSDVR